MRLCISKTVWSTFFFGHVTSYNIFTQFHVFTVLGTKANSEQTSRHDLPQKLWSVNLFFSRCLFWQCYNIFTKFHENLKAWPGDLWLIWHGMIHFWSGGLWYSVTIKNVFCFCFYNFSIQIYAVICFHTAIATMTDDKVFSILHQDGSYSMTFLQTLYSFFQAEVLCDVTIQVQNDMIKTHR